MTKAYENDPLGLRMKEYEKEPRVYLDRKKAVILRLDGRCFHSFTKGLKKPFDDVLIKTMEETMIKLCENIQGAKLGYHQSDEISILVTDWEKEKTECWFRYGIQKMVSIGASMATLFFNEAWERNTKEEIDRIYYNSGYEPMMEDRIYCEKLCEKRFKALFDCRAFTIPVLEIENYFIWREKDAIKNAVSMVGFAHFSHKALHGINSQGKIDMLLKEKRINFNALSPRYRRGACAVREDVVLDNDRVRKKWKIDHNIPDFRDDRDYITKRIELTKHCKG